MIYRGTKTEYDGQIFRSTLEARWAIFFDKIEVRWKYEDKKFKLPGCKYIPDFWLPDSDFYVEIKPKGYNGGHKCEALFRYTGTQIILAEGLPGQQLTAWLRGVGQLENCKWELGPDGNLSVGCSNSTDTHYPGIARAEVKARLAFKDQYSNKDMEDYDVARFMDNPDTMLEYINLFGSK